MSSAEVETLVLYLCEKLKDHHTIQPLVIFGFLSLVSHQDVTDDAIRKILATFFSEVHVQSLSQSDRHNVFNLFGNLLKLRLDVLKGVSGDFVLGYIQAVDGERDPRNLLLCFENSYTVLTNLDFTLFIEDFFEVLSCYFPVEFSPPKDNPFGITRQDLVDKLHRCLSCTPLFGPYSIALYVEKLSSDMAEAKLDALSLFTECFHMYNNEIQLFATDIWMCIRRDFLFGEDIVLKSKYKEFISRYIDCLSKETNAESLNSIMDSFIKACLQSLKDPDLSIAVQCGQLIDLFANKSTLINDQLLKSALVPLETTILKDASASQRSTLLVFVQNVLCIDPSKLSSDIQVTYLGFVSKLSSILYESLQGDQNMELTEASLLCLMRVMRYNDLFKVDPDIMCDHFFSMLFNEIKNCSSDILKRTFKFMSNQYPLMVEKKFIIELEMNSRESVTKYLCLLPLCPKDYEKRLLSYIMTLIQNNLGKNENLELKSLTVLANCFCIIMKSSKITYTKDMLFALLLDNLNQVIDSDKVNSYESDNAMFQYFKMVSSAFGNLAQSEQSDIVTDTATTVGSNNNTNSTIDDEHTFGKTVFVLLCALNNMSVESLHSAGSHSWLHYLLGMLASSTQSDKLAYYHITAMTIALLLNKIRGMKSSLYRFVFTVPIHSTLKFLVFLLCTLLLVPYKLLYLHIQLLFHSDFAFILIIVFLQRLKICSRRAGLR